MSRAQQVDVLWAGLKDEDGFPLSGGKISTYYAGSTSPVSLYTNASKTTTATNPIVLDANGRASVWADGSYKFIITDADDVPVVTIDDLRFGLPDDETIWAGNSTGTANAYVLSPSPALSAYANGQTISFIANFTNDSGVSSGHSTLNVSGVDAKPIKTGAGSELSGNEIVSGNIITVTYDSSADVFFLNTSSVFSTITVSGSGTFGSVNTATVTHTSNQTIGPSGGATYLRLKAGNINYWDLNQYGEILPVNNSNVNIIGSATYPVKKLTATEIATAEVKSASGSVFYFGYAEGDWFVNSSGYLCPNNSTKGGASKDIGFDSSPKQDVNTFRVRDIYISQSIRSGSNTFYFGTSTGDWFIPHNGADAHAIKPGASGYNIGDSTHLIGSLYLSSAIRKYVAGSPLSYSFTGTDTTEVRSITWSSLTSGTGTDTVNKTTLDGVLLSLGRAIATIWRDYYGAS